MKKQIVILSAFFFFAGSGALIGQTQETPKEVPIKADAKKEEVKKEFRDLNANGIDDTQESGIHNEQQTTKRKRDKFIDADGDGICDGRASGAGLKLRMHGTAAAKQTKKGKK